MPKPLKRFQGGVLESFVSEGNVSPVGVTEIEKPVFVLRDTGAAQTVRLNSMLPLSVDTDLHKSVLSVLGIQSINYHNTKLTSEVQICDW